VWRDGWRVGLMLRTVRGSQRVQRVLGAPVIVSQNVGRVNHMASDERNGGSPYDGRGLRIALWKVANHGQRALRTFKSIFSAIVFANSGV
jgi:hypothetical protein